MAKKDTTIKKQKKNSEPTDDLIEISKVGDGNAIAAGRGAKATSVVINFFGGKWQLLISLFVIIFAIGGYFLWKELYPTKMTGDFRIAVADFAIIGNSDEANTGTELAEGVYLKLNETLSEISKDFTVTIWSPAKVGKVKGATPEERASSAENAAKRIGADVLVYGLIDMSEPVWKITPEFYIASENFHDAEEITGQYQIGETFSLVGQESVARRIELSNKYEVRAQVISRITIGLAYYSLRDFQNALEVFQATESISGWDDGEGKEVLYLLAGNAAMMTKDLDTSIDYLNSALSIDPDYGRPLITLGSVHYLQALAPFEKTKKTSDIDLKLLDKAIEKYNQALQAEHQPALSDISTKVHFGLGQCYLMQTYAGTNIPLANAVEEFQIVVANYGEGKNPRIRELAAESHARLGLINDLSGYSNDAAQEYQLAAELLFDNPERQKQYQERAQKLSTGITITTP